MQTETAMTFNSEVASFELDRLKLGVQAEVDLLKAYADYNYRMMEVLQLQAAVEIDQLTLSVMRDAFNDFELARRRLLQQIKSKSGQVKRIADHAKHARKVAQGETLPHLRVAQVWVGFNYFLKDLPVDLETELIGLQVSNSERDGKHFSHNIKPNEPCDSAPVSVRFARQLVEFLRVRNYMPRIGTPPYLFLQSVVKLLSTCADNKATLSATALNEARAELASLRAADWKVIDIGRKPKTPDDVADHVDT